MSTPTHLKEVLTASIRDFKAPEIAHYTLKTNQLNKLIQLALDKNELTSSRAMWVLGHCSDINYEAIKPFHIKLIDNLKHTSLHNGVIRNTLRLFQNYPIPKTREAFMIDVCYGYIKNCNEAIAVRSFAITIVFAISKPYPELINKLKLVLLNLNFGEESPGMKSKIKNTLKLMK